MTDSELLEEARGTEMFSLQILGRSNHLARFVADMLDDSPVTEEALREMGFVPDPNDSQSDRDYIMQLSSPYDFIAFNIRNKAYSLHDTVDWVGGAIKTLGQLRHLLRGLGVGV